MEQEWICSICLEGEVVNGVELPCFILPPCNHRFHTACIVEALRRNGANCPLCRGLPDGPQLAQQQNHDIEIQNHIDQGIQNHDIQIQNNINQGIQNNINQGILDINQNNNIQRVAEQLNMSQQEVLNIMQENTVVQQNYSFAPTIVNHNTKFEQINN